MTAGNRVHYLGFYVGADRAAAARARAHEIRRPAAARRCWFRALVRGGRRLLGGPLPVPRGSRSVLAAAQCAATASCRAPRRHAPPLRVRAQPDQAPAHGARALAHARGESRARDAAAARPGARRDGTRPARRLRARRLVQAEARLGALGDRRDAGNRRASGGRCRRRDRCPTGRCCGTSKTRLGDEFGVAAARASAAAALALRAACGHSVALGAARAAGDFHLERPGGQF